MRVKIFSRSWTFTQIRRRCERVLISAMTVEVKRRFKFSVTSRIVPLTVASALHDADFA